MSQILAQGSTEDKGANARLQSFVGAIAIGDLIKSTLGPRGQDKILISHDPSRTGTGNITVTNDGATILRSLLIDNPSAKILINMSQTQDSVIGDGTTGVVVLAANMLAEAEKLSELRIHPQIIIEGFRLALNRAREKLEEIAINHSKDEVEMKKDLINIAKTTLSSKLLNQEKKQFAVLAVDAVLRIKEKPLEYIAIVKKIGGSLKESYLEEGLVLEKRLPTGAPKVIKKSDGTPLRVMMANTPLDTDKIKIYGAKVKVDSLTALAEIEEAEKEKMQAKIAKIASHKIDVFVNRQLIYNYPEQLFKDHKITAIEHADFEGTETLAAVLGADIASTFDGKIKIGSCSEIREILIGEDKLIQFKGCEQREACTIILRGASAHVLDEAHRSLHDALAVIYQAVRNEKRVVYGGGAAETAMASAVFDLASKTEGKVSMAIEAFGKALLSIPSVLSENGGFDSAELVGQLRALHSQGKHTLGLDLFKGEVADMADIGVVESFRSKMSQICAAAEGAEMIIRVDDIIKCAPRQRQ
jgi:T-complex protein 1 subunit beta